MDELEQPVSNKKTLEKYDQAMLELLLERTKLHQEQLRIVQMTERIRQLEVENLRLKSEISLLQAHQKEQPDPKVITAIEQLNVLIQQSRKAKAAFTTELIAKYGIKDSTFGFDQDTGEIIENFGDSLSN